MSGKENDRRAAGVQALLASKEPAEFLKCMVDLFRTKDGNCRAQLMTARAAASAPISRHFSTPNCGGSTMPSSG